MKRFIYIIFNITFVVGGCRMADPVGSNLFVINGGVVTKPDQAPGTYSIKSFVNGQLFGNASAVAIGPNSFITSGHVINAGQNIPTPVGRVDQMQIVDYQGRVVSAFDPADKGVKMITNPDYQETKNPATDLGAIVLPNDLSADKLTQGIVPIGSANAQVGDAVRLVGAGISDYRVESENAKSFADQNSGVLRWGTNSVSEVRDFNNKGSGFYIDGRAYSNSVSSGDSVSGPGDSGGGAFLIDKNGTPSLVGLMQGGDPVNKRNDNDYDVIPSSVGGSNQAVDQAFSFVTDVTKQSSFLENVRSQGGNISIPTYYNPNSFQKYDADTLSSNQEMYGDAWRDSAIVRSADNTTYSGYPQGGEYRWRSDGSYQWYDKNGNATSNYTTYDKASGSWKNSKTPSTPVEAAKPK